MFRLVSCRVFSGLVLVFMMLGSLMKCGLFRCRLVVIMVGRFIFSVFRLVLILWVIVVLLLVMFSLLVKVVCGWFYSVVSIWLVWLVLLLIVCLLRIIRFGCFFLISLSRVCVVVSGWMVWLVIMWMVWLVFIVRLLCRWVWVLAGVMVVIIILVVMFLLCRCSVFFRVILLKGLGDSLMLLVIMLELFGLI